MSYRKFRADYLFDGYRLHDSQQILITGGDGTVKDIVHYQEAGGEVEELTGIICPGLVNCHCHLELSHLKGRIPEKTGLVDFVFSVVSQRKSPAAEIQEAIRAAESEMLEAGIVLTGDICNGADSLAQKTGGRMAWYNFIELAGWLPEQARKRFGDGEALYRQFAAATGEAHLSLSPHAPYSVSPDLWELLETGFPHKTISIHNQETAAEDEFFISAGGELLRMYEMMKIDPAHFTATGSGSLSYYLDRMAAAGNILLVHNTYSSAADLERAVAFSPDLFFCLCPNANLYIEDRLPDINAMLQLKANLVIGTDSLASNRQLSVLEEMKTISRHFPAIETASLLQWATSNGSRALQYADQFGDFKKGKRPGVALISCTEDGRLDDESSCRRIL